jgi:putative transposase
VEGQRQLYNAALEERIDCYRKTGRTITYIDQCAGLTVCRRELPEMAAMPLKLQRGTLKRLDRAFMGFFRRVKAGQKPGFPRFKGWGRFNTLEWAELKGITFDGKRIRSKVFGSIRVHMHRPMEGEIKAVRITRDGKGWYVCFACEVDAAEQVSFNPVRSIGIKVGFGDLATLSTGEKIPTARAAKRAAAELRQRQRALARCKRGSNRRRKVRARLVACHRKVRNVRRTHAHQVSRDLVDRFDLIAVEDLDIAGMQDARWLNRLIADAGMGLLVDLIGYKAERAGVRFEKVDPRNTSRDCSGCGAAVPKPLSERVHRCPECGVAMVRHENAARNILRKAVAGLGVHNVDQWVERAPGKLQPNGA